MSRANSDSILFVYDQLYFPVEFLMRSYSVKAINVGSFDLGEADRVLTLFSPEKGLIKAVAKGARKPGTKMSGRSELLSVNELLLARGRSFEIITQAQTLESFSGLRSDLASLSCGLYYAELTACFGQGLEEDAGHFFDFLTGSLRRLAADKSDALGLCMEFQLQLLDFLGYRPELTFCVVCRAVLTDYNLSRFNTELGGVICSDCHHNARRISVRESADPDEAVPEIEIGRGFHITPLVWKLLVLRSEPQSSSGAASSMSEVQKAAQRLLQAYLEQRAGKKFKSPDMLGWIS